MFATAVFEFDQGDNGWLMAEFAFVRSLFLIFIFPPLIDLGRRWTTKRPASAPPAIQNGELASDQLPTSPGQFDTTLGEQTNEEPVKAVQNANEEDSRVFDLIFLRWNLLFDGALTTIAAFATKRWHIYLGTSI